MTFTAAHRRAFLRFYARLRSERRRHGAAFWAICFGLAKPSDLDQLDARRDARRKRAETKETP